MAVRRAPATRCPISSPLSPSLTSLFSTLFLPSSPLPSPFPFLSLLRHTRVTYTLSTKPCSSLATLLFRFSLVSCHQDTNISISAFVALTTFSALFHDYVSSSLYFWPLRNLRCLTTILSLITSESFPRSLARVCRFIRQARR